MKTTQAFSGITSVFHGYENFRDLRWHQDPSGLIKDAATVAFEKRKAQCHFQYHQKPVNDTITKSIYPFGTSVLMVGTAADQLQELPTP